AGDFPRKGHGQIGIGGRQVCQRFARLIIASALAVASGNLYKALSRCRKALAAEGRNIAPAREVSHG
ncbi:MAG: hypothetical protein AAFR94_07995, partial [Pseudomonadota bacterium]